MKLMSVQVENFQSIRNSNRFEISDITCLVGKNEAGKTALLQALYRLNPIIVDHGNFEAEDDYPRSDVDDYINSVKSGRIDPANVATAVFNIDAEIPEIEAEFGEGILKSNQLTLMKGYSNRLTFAFSADEMIAVKALVEQAQLPTDLSSLFASVTTISLLQERITQYENEETLAHLERLNKAIDDINSAGGLKKYIYLDC